MSSTQYRLAVSFFSALSAILAGILIWNFQIFQSPKVGSSSPDTKQSTSSSTNILQTPSTSLVNDTQDYYQDTVALEPCSYFQCLFKASGEVIGYAELDGYYRPEVVTGGGEENAYAGQIQTCDKFVVTGGSKPLINQLLDMIKSGNTLNEVIGTNLVINLNLSDPNLDTPLVSRIRLSTAQNQISLGVLQTYREGKGAGPCTSVIRVVNENKTLSAK
ncbi:MAG: hypothetical protein ACYC1Y_02060 [Minisyncoccota bacterium]